LKSRLRLGKRKTLNKEGWVSNFIQPSGKFWKRQASKRSRQSVDVSDGTSHKKYFGWHEWS